VTGEENKKLLSPATGRGRNRKGGASATERSFIAAATQLFAERGYNGTSIADVAKELGLTSASLYYHVEGKQDLLLRVLETGMADFLDRLEAVVSTDLGPREKLFEAVRNHLDFVLNNQAAVAVFLRERRFLDAERQKTYHARVERYDTLFTQLVREAMDVGAIPAGQPTLVRLGILGMINWVAEWYRPDGGLEKSVIMDELTSLIMDRMLAPPSAR
jgi:AcrR family transcriptional regulator